MTYFQTKTLQPDLGTRPELMASLHPKPNVSHYLPFVRNVAVLRSWTNMPDNSKSLTCSGSAHRDRGWSSTGNVKVWSILKVAVQRASGMSTKQSTRLLNLACPNVFHLFDHRACRDRFEWSKKELSRSLNLRESLILELLAAGSRRFYAVTESKEHIRNLAAAYNPDYIYNHI